MAETKKYLDITAAGHLAEWVNDTYTKQEEGKGLSTNDLTNDLLTKLNASASTEDLEDKVDKVDGKGLSTNDYTTDEKEKLEAVESGAQVNVIESIKVDGTELTATEKGVNIDLSGKVDKVEGKGLSTNDLTDALLNKLNGAASTEDIANLVSIDFVTELPEEPAEKTMYFLLRTDPETGDKYDEYVYKDGAWEKLGTMKVDFSGVWGKDELVAVTTDELDAVLNAI